MDGWMDECIMYNTSAGISMAFTGSALLISVNRFSTAGKEEVWKEYTSTNMFSSSAGQLLSCMGNSDIYIHCSIL
jgi:hypothetical protein